MSKKDLVEVQKILDGPIVPIHDMLDVMHEDGQAHLRKEQHEPLCKTSRALPVGSEGCTCTDLLRLRAPLLAKEDMDRCYKYAVTLLKALVPSCEPLTTLMGVLSQIDNWCSGQKNWATEKEQLISCHREEMRYRDDMEV